MTSALTVRFTQFIFVALIIVSGVGFLIVGSMRLDTYWSTSAMSISEMRGEASTELSNRSFFLRFARHQDDQRATTRMRSRLEGFYFLDIAGSETAALSERLSAAREAREIFTRLITDAPTDALALSGLGLSLVELGDRDGAIRALQLSFLYGPQIESIRWPRALLAARLWPDLSQTEQQGALNDMTELLKNGQLRDLGQVFSQLPTSAEAQVTRDIEQKGLDVQSVTVLWRRTHRDN